MIVVTGGCGFIGSTLVDLLINEKYEVAVIDNLSTGKILNLNPKAYFCENDLLAPSAECVRLLSTASHIFHMAALPRIQPSFEDPIGHDDANVRTTLNIFKYLTTNASCGLTISSSSSVYGTSLHTPTTEDESISPLSPYALQKYAAEQYALILGRRLKLRVNALRYFNVYGPRSYDEKSKYNAYSSVVGIFSELNKKNLPITVTGDGTQLRDFVHVEDVARANIASLRSSVSNEVFNIGTGTKTRIIDLARMFSENIVYLPERDGEAQVTHASIRKVTSMLDWSPKISLSHAVIRGLI